MKIGGLVRFSLNDYPGRVAAVVFTQGCNFRCPFCHNAGLLPRAAGDSQSLAEQDVLQFCNERVGKLDGIVISGGEPTLQPDLPRFISAVRKLGFAIKLDTNGSRPDVVAALLDEHLLDFVAMDVKAPLSNYARLAGAPVDVDAIRRSIRIIAAADIPHEFRTTHVESLLSSDALRLIRAALPPASPHRVQRFDPQLALDPTLRSQPTAATTGAAAG